MLRFNLILIISLAILLSSTVAKGNPSEIPPMIDGRCDEYSGKNASQVKMDEAVTLHIYQDKHFVWLCYNYPEGSFGTLDMRIEAPGLEEALNLHISAQLGEWPADKPDQAPTKGDSPMWWNHKGWTANEVWFNGYRMRETEKGEEQVANWRNAPAREMQLSKKHFGQGEWKLRFKIYAIQGKDDKRYELVYPSEETFYILKTN